ncbi:MAG TPA: MBL fold metallo-hydrolase, partial [Myxococcota bacterium]|nr:MBL fold metallo-hydrolase [Myxococcota bacterium]
MELTFWGVRGSIPVPGAQTARWGGNSSCIALRHADLPALVLDCGTGARALGEQLARERKRDVVVLFTHLHADHVFGFPFFLPLYLPGSVVRVGVPSYSDDEARERLGRYVNGTFHPMRLRDLPARVEYFAVRPGRVLEVEGWTVRPVRLHHPGGSVGYRVDAGGASAAYLTDTSPFASPGEGVAAGEEPTSAEARLIEAIRGCDVVLFDTMFEYAEYLERMTWGHSYPEYAIALAAAAGVRHLVLFHHAPDASDDRLDAWAARYADREGPRVTLAREGDTL